MRLLRELARGRLTVWRLALAAGIRPDQVRVLVSHHPWFTWVEVRDGCHMRVLYGASEAGLAYLQSAPKPKRMRRIY